MKKYLPLLLLLLTFSNCKKDNEPQIITNTDISVSSTENMIVYTSDDELVMLINEILIFDYNGVPTNEVITYVTIESDSTELRASIDFKEEHREKYVDPNPNNNFVVIDLEKSQALAIDNELDAAINADQFCEMYEILRDELPLFNITTQNFVCIPLTFLIPTSINVEQTDLDNAVEDLNQNFLDAKISFDIAQVKQIPDNPYYNLQIDAVQNYTHDVPNTLNVYIANSLKEGNTNLNGLGHFPTEYLDRVYAKGSFFDEGRDKYSALLTHEVGHFLSLYHTFETAVPSCLTGSGCFHTGDAVCDTPEDGCCPISPSFTYGLVCEPATNSDNRLLVQNFMSYALNVWTLRNCQRRFTPDQLNRAAFAARFWKSHLTCQGSTGSSNIQLSGDLNFGNVQVNTTSSPKTLRISNTGSESFNITNMASTNSTFTIFNAQSALLQPNDFIDINIQFNPTALQNYTVAITITNNADNATNNSTIQVTGTGVDNSGTSIIALSGNLDFGNVSVGGSTTQNFTIQNNGNQAFNVSNITYPFPVYSSTWTSGTIQPGNPIAVAVVFQPSTSQNYNGLVTVYNNADSGSNTIDINGTGVSTNNFSEISISPNPINFGNVEVGESRVMEVLISNTGNQPFTFYSITYPIGGIFSVSPTTGTVQANSNVPVTFNFFPNAEQNYSGTFLVNHDADQGTNTVPVYAHGVSSGQPNLIYANYDIDDDDNDNGIVEAGEDIDLEIRLENIGNTAATDVEVIISTNDSDINITDDKEYYDDIPAGGLEWNGGVFDFSVSSNCPTKTVTFYMTINSDEGSWNDSFTIDVEGQSNNTESITPNNSCSSAPVMQIDTEYEVSIDIGNYSSGYPIDGESSGGNNIRGFWLAFQVPNGQIVNNIEIYDVSNNFDPVVGVKTNCSTSVDLYDISSATSNFDTYSNQSGTGGNETFENYFYGPGYNENGLNHIRIYHYYGNETPNVSFKIIVE